MFLILVARAIAPVWEVIRSSRGVLCNLAKKRTFVNHYSFHILDPEWGHLTLHLARRPHRPGSDRRHLVAARDHGGHLVAARDHRAPDPGL